MSVFDGFYAAIGVFLAKLAVAFGCLFILGLFFIFFLWLEAREIKRRHKSEKKK